MDISSTPDIAEKTKVVYGGDLTGSNVTGTDFEVNGGYLYVTGVYNPTSNDIWNGFAVMPDN